MTNLKRKVKNGLVGLLGTAMIVGSIGCGPSNCTPPKEKAKTEEQLKKEKQQKEFQKKYTTDVTEIKKVYDNLIEHSVSQRANMSNLAEKLDSEIESLSWGKGKEKYVLAKIENIYLQSRLTKIDEEKKSLYEEAIRYWDSYDSYAEVFNVPKSRKFLKKGGCLPVKSKQYFENKLAELK